MEFSFEVNPDLDVAIGTEIGIEDIDTDFEVEDYASLGVDPLDPTAAKPGSEEKVRMLAARYAAGVPLWHDEDCYDHGPADLNNLGLDGYDDEDPVEEELEF